VHQIYSSMQTGQEKMGMQTMNQCLATLYQKRLITLEAAMEKSSLKDELEQMIARGTAWSPARDMPTARGGPPPRAPRGGRRQRRQSSAGGLSAARAAARQPRH
jgi:twitching motility protein PilT